MSSQHVISSAIFKQPLSPAFDTNGGPIRPHQFLENSPALIVSSVEDLVARFSCSQYLEVTKYSPMIQVMSLFKNLINLLAKYYRTITSDALENEFKAGIEAESLRFSHL